MCGISWWLGGKESTCQCGRHGFDTWVRKPLQKEMATHFCILAWEIPWTEGPWDPTGAGYSPWGRKSQTQLSNQTIATRTAKCVVVRFMKNSVLVPLNKEKTRNLRVIFSHKQGSSQSRMNNLWKTQARLAC